MTVEFRLPDVGEGLEEAEIIEWLVSVGDVISRDQPLVEILTDKSQTQLPAPVAGTVTSLGFDAGDLASVGQVLVTIDDGGETSAVEEAVTGATAAGSATEVGSVAELPEASGPRISGATGRRPKASPAVRREALEAGIDLRAVVGTGPGGRILSGDLDRAAQPPSQVGTASEQPTSGRPAADTTLGQMPSGRHPLRGIRRVTAEAMERSWQIPHIHGADEMDASALLAARRSLRDDLGHRASTLTPMAFFVLAVADALRRYPLVNASIDTDAGEIVVHDRVNIGIAVATPNGLLVPVITDADQLSLLGAAEHIATLSTAARNQSITAEQMRHGTCTITNYGSLGGRFSSPIIRAPEAAIVGFGSIRERPFVADGAVTAKPTLPVVTAADHRLIDGDLMTAFQERVVSTLTNPILLVAR